MGIVLDYFYVEVVIVNRVVRDDYRSFVMFLYYSGFGEEGVVFGRGGDEIERKVGI